MNLLGVPGKASIPVDLAVALREHIAANFHDAHPDQFTEDYDVLRRLRTAIVVKPDAKAEVHASILQQMITYHAQLVFILNKFPSDVDVAFPWLPAFATMTGGLAASLPGMLPSASLISIQDIHFERASVLFNVAAMHASIGALETRTEQAGIKRALNYFQHAAGCFALLAREIVQTIRRAPGDPELCSPDFTESALAALEHFCLAQAQECFWQQAVLDRLKSGTIAKLSARVAELYGQALDEARAAKGAGGVWPAFAFPQDFINHIDVKRAHFTAAAQYRKSLDDLEANRYGDEVARLRAADTAAKEGLAVSKKGISSAVIGDLKVLQATIADNLARATKDNDLIYLQPVPTVSTLTAIVPAAMTKGTLPVTVANPLEALHDGSGGLGRPVFETLVSYAVHQALSVFSDRVETFIRSELSSRIEELDALAASTLQSLGLPGSIEALETPATMPPALLRKAAEVRSEGGSSKLRSLLHDVQRLAASCQATLDAAQRSLTGEAADDAKQRQTYGRSWTRPTSADAAVQLNEKVAQLSETLRQARESDKLVRNRFTEWEGSFDDLSRPESELQDTIPAKASAVRKRDATSDPRQAQAIRRLHYGLEKLDELSISRKRLLEDARHLASTEDIRPAVLRSATAQDVTVAAFEPLFEKEIAKYGRFEDALSDNARHQEEQLEAIRMANDSFIEARHEDATLRAREQVLQRLDLAYHKHRELFGNLTEGLRFYKEMTRLLIDLRKASDEFARARHREGQVQMATLTQGVSDLLRDPQSPMQSPSKPSGPWQPSEGIRFE